MGTVIVDVMPKPEILDPQGQAVANALNRLDIGAFTEVRQGKRFTLEVTGEVTQAALDSAREAAETVLSNPVIEDVVAVYAAPEDGPASSGHTSDGQAGSGHTGSGRAGSGQTGSGRAGGEDA